MKNDYYLGLDVGTNSVGWAVTDTDYRIPKFNGNSAWGIRLFDESQTAAERRSYRISRRRTQRRRERLDLLEMLFDGEISKIDCSFFKRLRESNLYYEDKTTGGKYAVFADRDYTDKDFYAAYPTIYHLRKELIDNPAEHDARLVFIALHHIIKNRGHFLFDSLDADQINDFELIYRDLEAYLYDNYEIEISCESTERFSEILKDRRLSKTAKNAQIARIFNITKKSDPQAYACLTLLSGSTVKLCDIFNDAGLKDIERKSITFSGSFDDLAEEYQSILADRYELIEKLKAVYDWAILADILNGERYISYSKVKVYEKHKQDLAKLKRYVKKYMLAEYKEIFKQSKDKLNNYTAYSGCFKENSRTGVLQHSCSQQEFCDYLRKKLGDCRDEEFSDMFAEIEVGVFMPKQVSRDNSVIPMQLHRAELIAILNNAKNYLPFLLEKDSGGLSVYEKVIAIFDYKIPYYVGPLNTHSKNQWIVRSKEKIYPWNFEQVVDTDKTAEAFIQTLTSKCTYLPDKGVIPKNSILYARFMVLNELNNLKIDSKDIDVSLKQDIFNDLFMNYNKVTGKKLKDYLVSKGVQFETISGIDGDFKASLKPLRDLNQFTSLSVDEKEEIIYTITIFGDDKKLLKKRLRNKFADKLSEEELQKIFKLKYSDWSNLSREFLTEVESVDKTTGEVVNIITALWQTNNNLMQLLYSDNFEFNKRLKEMNSFGGEKSMRQMVEELYVSPKVKRPIYQALLIAKEIEKIQKCPPKKIFVEVTRREEEKERKKSRKERLVEWYKESKMENEELYQQLLGTDEDELKQDKLYLYYAQLGRCMYTGEKIELSLLMGNNSSYDIDHIFPRSKLKDDSLDNRVLVKKTINDKKGNTYPLSKVDTEIQAKMTPFWRVLLSKKLITQKKFERLVRTTPLSDDELSAFISRQIVETSQSTKAIANILEQMYPSPQTEIVYVKARLASSFRHDYDMLKSREVNDLHHAKDAYLNIVVGNVYNVKFTHNKRNFIKGLQMDGAQGFSLNKMFDYNTENAWVADNNESLRIVKKMMSKNNIRYTRYAHKQQGGLFKQNICKKGYGQVPIKGNGPRADMQKYGAYQMPSSVYFALAEYHDKKEKRIRAIVPIDAYKEAEYLENPTAFVRSVTGQADAVVIIPCIKYDSCISVDGFRMHLSCKSSGGKGLQYKPAVQLVLGYEKEKYIKGVTKYLTENSQREINPRDHISRQENLELFDALVDKTLNTIFAVKFSAFGAKLKAKRELFEALSLKEQCVVILEMLKILHCNASLGDLSLLKEGTRAGALTTSSNLSGIKNISSIKLINQSITGLFEQEIELLN